MSELLIKNLLRRLDNVERTQPHVRIGVVTSITPLSVALGGSALPYSGVKKVGSVALAVSDVVAAITYGNDLIVLGKIT